jgi:hypothetical protein
MGGIAALSLTKRVQLRSQQRLPHPIQPAPTLEKWNACLGSGLPTSTGIELIDMATFESPSTKLVVQAEVL